jgi:hypothetical protein
MSRAKLRKFRVGQKVITYQVDAVPQKIIAIQYRYQTEDGCWRYEHDLRSLYEVATEKRRGH